ncbi:hypothetical protein GCM10027567_19900 [Spongiibacter taiwanensis]
MHHLATEFEQSAQELMFRAGAESFCLVMFHADRQQGAVNFLSYAGMSSKVRRDYTSSLWQHDPFLLSVKDPEAKAGPFVRERRELEDKAVARPYWHFIDQIGYGDIIASIHPFTPEIHLIGAMMGLRRDGGARRDGALLALDSLVAQSGRTILNESLMRLFPAVGQGSSDQSAALLNLTRREEEVVLALREGKSNKQIADQLALSEFTVQNHFKRLFRKFDVRNRTELLSKIQSMALI